MDRYGIPESAAMSDDDKIGEWLKLTIRKGKIKAEIAEMVKDGDPLLSDLDRDANGMVIPEDYYNAGRIAGLRLALDILEGR